MCGLPTRCAALSQGLVHPRALVPGAHPEGPKGLWHEVSAAPPPNRPASAHSPARPALSSPQCAPHPGGVAPSVDSTLTWHDGLPALLAAGRVLVGIAVGAQQLVLLGGEGLVHQRAAALRAAEAALVPVTLLVG